MDMRIEVRTDTCIDMRIYICIDVCVVELSCLTPGSAVLVDNAAVAPSMMASHELEPMDQ